MLQSYCFNDTWNFFFERLSLCWLLTYARESIRWPCFYLIALVILRISLSDYFLLASYLCTGKPHFAGFFFLFNARGLEGTIP